MYFSTFFHALSDSRVLRRVTYARKDKAAHEQTTKSIKAAMASTPICIAHLRPFASTLARLTQSSNLTYGVTGYTFDSRPAEKAIGPFLCSQHYCTPRIHPSISAILRSSGERCGLRDFASSPLASAWRSHAAAE